MRLMADAQLLKRYSVDGLLTELEMVKAMILPEVMISSDIQKITTEITKKHR